IQVALAMPLVLAWIVAMYQSNSRRSTNVTDWQASTNELQPGSSEAVTSAAPDRDFALHVERLKKRLPSTDFTILVQPPFVVIGDEATEAIKEHSERTIKWAVDKLKQDYFSQDPKEILDIWLFKDAASYERNALLLFGEKPTTPYGYYSSDHKALVM